MMSIGLECRWAVLAGGGRALISFPRVESLPGVTMATPTCHAHVIGHSSVAIDTGHAHSHRSQHVGGGGVGVQHHLAATVSFLPPPVMMKWP